MSRWLSPLLRRWWAWLSPAGAAARLKRAPSELTLEHLEPRVLMSSQVFGGVPGFSPPGIADDRLEENDTRAAATDLGLIAGAKTLNGLVLRDDDWYRFRTQAAGTPADFVQVTFLHRRGDLDLELRDASGRLLAEADGETNVERIPLYELSARTYFVRVFGDRGATNAGYTLRIQSAGDDDRFEPNDTRETANSLGTLTTAQIFADLQGLDDDWFRFTTTRTGTNASFVQIGFDGLQGDLDLRLYDRLGNLLDASNGTGHSEFLSLAGRPAGTYYARVNLFNGQGVQYDLSIAPPNAADAEHTVFLNFDGAALTRTDLNRWSHNGGNGLNPGEWMTGLQHPTSGLDDDRNGIQVSPFWKGALDREAVIAGVLRNLNSDLRAFGMQAVRHFGLAVEGVQATTLFLGPSTLTNGLTHVASAIDEGNDNRTDIALIGNDDARRDLTTTARKILAISDVALHEAGHTFGLYHVRSGSNTETMGLRYNQPTSRWLQDTTFQNRTYPLREIPGLFQNSFHYMRETFVLNQPPSPVVSPWSPLNSDLHRTPLFGSDDVREPVSLLSVSHVAASEPFATAHVIRDDALLSLTELSGGTNRRR